MLVDSGVTVFTEVAVTLVPHWDVHEFDSLEHKDLSV